MDLGWSDTKGIKVENVEQFEPSEQDADDSVEAIARTMQQLTCAGVDGKTIASAGLILGLLGLIKECGYFIGIELAQQVIDSYRSRPPASINE